MVKNKLRDIVDINKPYGKISIVVSTVQHEGGVYETAWFSSGQISVDFHLYKITKDVNEALKNHEHVLEAFKEGLININISDVNIQLMEDSTGA
jgi:adenosylcobinamide amidohydrolase